VSASKAKVSTASTRQWPRFSHLKEVSLTYEGRSEELSVHPPDISLSGMFLNTMTTYAEGTILKVRFRLSQSNHLVEVRCEVRYCLPGVGVGVEFIDIGAKDKKAILKELEPPAAGPKRVARKKRVLVSNSR